IERVGEQRLTMLKRPAAGRILRGKQQRLMNEALARGENQRLQTEVKAVRFQKRQAGIVMLHNAAKALGDGGEEISDVAIGEQNVVNIEQEAEAVALGGDLLLVSERLLPMSDVVDRKGNLLRDAPQEIQI